MFITNGKTLKDLEFERVKARVAALAGSSLGQEIISRLQPTDQLESLTLEFARLRTFQRAMMETDLSPGGISDLRPVLESARQTTALSPEDFPHILQTLMGCRRLKDRLDALPDPAVLSELADRIGIFRELEENIRRVVDEEGRMRDSATPRLRELTRRKRHVEERVQHKLQALIQSSQYAGIIQEPIITRRSSRLVIPVRSSVRHEIDCVVHDSSDSGQTLYVEPTSVVEDNNDIRQLDGEIRDERLRILKELTAKLQAESRKIEETLRAVAYLDSLYARARYAEQMRCGIVQLQPSGPLHLLEARHPLLDPQTVVPIDVHLVDGYQGIVITGPNTGGKTVSLKTLGLLVLMAQSGIPIPASPDSSLPLYQRVFSDIGDEQSIQQNLSTFSAHMTNLISILNQVDERTLVLIDELGAGTDPTEGAALGIALLKALIERGAKLVVTTHLSALKHFAYQHEKLKTCSVEFDVQTLSPTYRLIEGVGASNAFVIAERLGLDPAVIEVAKGHLTEGHTKVEDLIRQLQQERQALSEERAQLNRCLNETESIKREYAIEVERIQSEKARALSRDLRELDDLIRRAKTGVEEALALAKRGGSPDQLRDSLRQVSHLETQLEEAEVGLAPPRQGVTIPLPVEDLRQGARVWVEALGKIGFVRKIASLERIEAEIEGLRVWTRLTDLRKPPVEKMTAEPSESHSVSVQATSTPQLELHVRGMTVPEALLEVDRYLDRLLLAGMTRGYIIHGKGAGILRREIRKHLADQRHVRRCYDAPAPQGGDGLTIVELE